MTRRDFQLLGEAIRSWPADFGRRYDVACHLADCIAAQHPSFNRQKFFQACQRKGESW